MKKVYLFLAGLLLSLGTFAQNPTLQIFDVNGNDVTNTTYALPGFTPGDTEVKLYIKNTGAETVSVKVSRDNVQMPTGFSNFLCFGITCFPEGANVTTFATDINSAQVDSSFHGLYRDNGNPSGGDLCITYTFFDENNPDNYVTVRVYYGNCLAASVSESVNETPSVSAFPNPASGSVLIKYNVTGDAQLIITDITGKMLKNIRLNNGSQSTQVDISDLRSGIYVYSVQSGSKRIISKKLVVR